jgi:hypothetical protein
MNRVFSLALAGLCLTAPASAQFNSVQGAAQASPYTRLILATENTTPQYELLKFTNATHACNFYGASSVECRFANEYFAGWGGSYTATLEFARFPGYSTRAHIYGGGAVALSSPAQLAAALDAGTTLNVPLNGVTLTACFGAGTGCTNLAGSATYDEIASAVASALNASPVTLGTITGTITPVSMALNVGIQRYETAVQVNSVGGTLYNGAYVCAKSQPCLSSSSDQINQIELQMIWVPETVREGPGWYAFKDSPLTNGFHMPMKETISGTASYGVLTVTSYNGGSAIAAPMGINDGGAHIPATSYVWECISLCGQVGAQWIVSNAATVSKPETMNLTSVPITVYWNSRVNGPTAWGYFNVAQNGDARQVGANNTTGYATGSAAKILGLSEGSPGYPGVLYSGAFASSPGRTVRSIGAWLDHFRTSVDSSWTSCEIDYSFPDIPDSMSEEIQDWATKHPPIQCPVSWVTSPVSTPSLLSCIDHEPTCPRQ